jgi:ATP-dependent exoDNAse (exonuclease V) beta subunit
MFNHVKLDKVVPRLQQINENGVRHYMTPEGNKYPSITTVLSEYSRKGIYEWRQRVGDEAANRISGKASTRGTKLHKACEDYINNLEPEFRTPFERDLFKRFTPTLHRINNVYAQEIRMYSDHLRIAGTVDCIGEFDGKMSVIDFKTSAKEKDKEYIENYFMQCSAYAIMFEEQYGIPVSQTVVAIAVEDGESQVFIEKRDTHVKRLIHFRDLYERKSSLITH